jgi:effector-binding domain-containing protein
MRKFLTIIGILLAIILILALIAPKNMHIERSALIKAPPQLVYDHLRHFKNFDAWSPWAELDSNMTAEISGTDGEVGAKYNWKSDQIGNGTQEIVGLKENENVDIKLTIADWGNPSDAGFKLENVDGDTRVTWQLKSKLPIPFNIMTLFTDFSGMVGKDYEKGLSKLKTVCEALAASGNIKPQTSGVKEVDFAGGIFATIRKTVAFKDISAFFANSFMPIMKEVARNKQTMVGNPHGFYYEYDEKKQQTDMAAALPISGEAPLENGVKSVKLPASKALCVDYYGDYAKSAPAYEAIELYAKEKSLKTGSPATEEYITDPMLEKDTAKWLTRICFPITK